MATVATNPVVRCHQCGHVAGQKPLRALRDAGWRIRQLGADKVKHQLVHVCPECTKEGDW